MAAEKTGSTSKQWLNALIASAPMLTYGMQSGWMSPSIPILQGPNSPFGYLLTDMEISLVASSMIVAATVSCSAYSILADRYGRKISLISIALPQALGWVIKLTSANPTALIISQIFAGIAGGGVFSIIPMYTKEISADSIRGMVGSVGVSLQSVGYLIMYGICAFMDYYTVLWIVTWLPVLNCILLLWTPESPPYLVKTGRLEEARKVLGYLNSRDKEDKLVKLALSELTTAQEQIENLPKLSLRRVYKASRRAVLLGLLMITIVDTAGNYAILTYASVILKQSEVTILPLLQAMSIPAIMLVGGVVSTLTVAKFGRKILLIICLIITALVLSVLALVLLLQDCGYLVPPWIPVLAIAVSIFCYGAGVLPIPYIVMSEIVSFELRAKCMGFYVTLGWFLSFLQVITFIPVSQILGMYGVFFIYSAFNLINSILCCVFMPETKGLSSAEIAIKMKGNNK